MEPLKLLIIGMDPPVHFDLMLDPEIIEPEMELVALAASHDDSDEIEKLSRIAGERGLRFSEHWQDLIDKVNAVVYLGPYGYRGDAFLQIFSAKELEVLIIDKPLVCTLDELNQVEAARISRPDLDILPLLTVRYDDRYEIIKRLYETGTIGEVIKAEAWRPHKLGKRPEWFFKKETYPGVIQDLCVHDVDIITYITGQRIIAVHGAYEIISTKEAGKISAYGGFGATLENGAVVSITADWLTGPEAPYHGDTGLSLTGTKGKLELISDGSGKGLYIETRNEFLSSLGPGWDVEVIDATKGYFKVACPQTDYSLDFRRTLEDFFLFRKGSKERLVVTMEDLVAATKVTVIAGEIGQRDS